jgi:hypothetical protein
VVMSNSSWASPSTIARGVEQVVRAGG